MNFLFINTACHPRGIAIVSKERVLASHFWRESGQDSDQIFSSLEDLEKEAAINLKDLSGIMVVKGPGSFTGLRVGITVANALAYSYDLGIHSLLTSDFLHSVYPDRKGFFWHAGLNNSYLASSSDKVELLDCSEVPEDMISVEDLNFEEAEKNLVTAITKWSENLDTTKITQPFYLKPAGVTKPKKQINFS